MENGIFQLYSKNNVTEFRKKIQGRLIEKKKSSWPYTDNLFIALRVSGLKKNIADKDLDNLLKTLFDTLKGIVFENDSQIIKISAEKIISSKTVGVSIGIKKLNNHNIIELYPQMWSVGKDDWITERQNRMDSKENLHFDYY